MKTGHLPQPEEAESEIEGMGDHEAEKISVQAETRQQQPQKDHVQAGGNGVVPNAGYLLSHPFYIGVGYGVQVEHGSQDGEPSQLPSHQGIVE